VITLDSGAMYTKKIMPDPEMILVVLQILEK